MEVLCMSPSTLGRAPYRNFYGSVTQDRLGEELDLRTRRRSPDYEKGKMAPERGEGPGEEAGVVPAHDTTPFSTSEAMLHIKEGDGAVEAVLERSEDDDLTSLTWLQDKNLLKGINLRNSVAVKQESPTSDYTEDSPSEQSESTCSSVNSCSPVPQSNSKNKHPHHIPYDPKIHVTSKPPYSFSCLIFMSIENSKGKALPVKEIYTWILDNFPYYRNAPTGWKNSVRHNLSLNKCFRKVDKAPNLGKGSLWMVDPVFRPNLVQALMKAPYHPYTNVEKGMSTPIKEESSPLPLNDNNESGIDYASQDELDDVDAATAMLVLKHGPHASLHLTQKREEYHKRHRMSLLSSIPNCVKTSQLIEEDNLSAMRPTEDHTYSAESGLEITSADEAFADGSDSNSSWSMTQGMYENDPEERRKTVEGADALLNLAGITTRPFPDRPSSPPPLKKPRVLSKSPHRLFALNNNTIMPSKLRRKPACPQKVHVKSKR